MKAIWIGLLAVVSASAQPSDRFQALDEVFSDYAVVQLNPSDIDYQVKVLEEPLTIEVDGSQLVFKMESRNLLSDRYRAEATGEGGLRRQLPLPEVETYKGTLIGAPDIQGRFTITDDSFEGVVFFDDWLFIEPAATYLDESEPADMVVYRKSDVTHDVELNCGGTHHFDEQGTFKADFPTAQATDYTTRYTAEVATEADYEFVRAVGGGRNANRNILSILNRVDGLYERQLALNLEVTYQHVWETSKDPYSGTDGRDLIEQFRGYWNANYFHEDYDSAHMWTARDMDGGGIAAISTVCRWRDLSYGVSKYYRNAPSSVSFIIAAHEIGHNFGADHPDQESPPVTACDGTVMQSDWDPTPSLNFCQFSRKEIRDHTSLFNSCFPEAAPPPPPRTVVPNAPSDLVTEAINSTLIRLEWQDNSTNENGFVIQRRVAGAKRYETQAWNSFNRTTFIDVGLEPSTTYLYRVLSFTESAVSANSNIAVVTTPAAGAAGDKPCGSQVVLTIPFTLRNVDQPKFFAGDPRFKVEVPANATGLIVTLKTEYAKDDVDLYVNHGSYPKLVDRSPAADHLSEGPTGYETVYVTSTSEPPLREGTYYFGVGLFTTGKQVKAVISAKLEY